MDNNVASKIVDASGAGKDDIVVEIGSGLGVMTAMIAKKAKKVIALEIDRRLIDVLHEELSGFSNIDILNEDVLKYDFSSPLCVDKARGKLIVIGNVPYNISSQIIFRLFDFGNCISSAVIMLQKEVAQRIMASPGTKEYGSLSVIASMLAEISKVMTVPSALFFPKPQVDSMVLKMVIRDRPLFDVKDFDFFLKLVRTSFSKRRKTLWNNLKELDCVRNGKANLDEILKDSGIDGGRRGETLTVGEFDGLSDVFWAKLTKADR
jgi:16S rRNA (adenine1518-N6/adenine1519-N6)-dimethyltransferase